MDKAQPASPRMIQSPHLSLFAATAGLIRKDIEGREALAAALGVDVPPSWPPDLYGAGAMRFALAQLNEAPEQGWSFWYLASREEPVELVGLCGFKGRPDTAGSVEIAYSVLSPYQQRGYATEAVGRLVGWAFSHHNVNEISAETMPHLRQSIRVLEKNGFRRAGAGSEAGVIRFVVKRAWLN